MAKWISPLFSDIRNKLGDNVVFSAWKGRGYFRSYVIPANPQTNKQQAHRDVLRLLVKRYQGVIASGEPVEKAEKVAVWKEIALAFLISGFNVFCKYGRKTQIAAETGSGSKEIDITYTLGLPAGKAMVYAFDGEDYEDVTPAEGLSAEPNSEATVTVGAAATEYTIFIAHADALVEGDDHPQAYAAITCWTPDIETGVAKAATATSGGT